MHKPIDLAKLTPEQLKNLLANAERMGEAATANAVVKEMAYRRLATRREYRALEWNQERIREIMRPFRDAASAVPGNQRTSYTEAGGLRIGSPKDDPEHLWIQTYCAIKTALTNATFGCNVKQPGDEPEFQLRTDRETVQIYNADQLSTVLEQWQSIARLASTEESTRARPMQGRIDYAELSREHLARYPNIRARLAE